MTKMPELIDREQAGKNICKYCASNAYCKEDDCIVHQGLRDTPTIQVEAEPVRRGRWIDVLDANTKVAKCSLCGFWQRTNGDDKTGKHLIHTAVYRYCAGCGARMDERGDDNG
jgi:Pyruvate/2-oxoacid:ferredoxin oxidoreductase delta subunit